MKHFVDTYIYEQKYVFDKWIGYAWCAIKLTWIESNFLLYHDSRDICLLLKFKLMLKIFRNRNHRPRISLPKACVVLLFFFFVDWRLFSSIVSFYTFSRNFFLPSFFLVRCAKILYRFKYSKKKFLFMWLLDSFEYYIGSHRHRSVISFHRVWVSVEELCVKKKWQMVIVDLRGRESEKWKSKKKTILASRKK